MKTEKNVKDIASGISNINRENLPALILQACIKFRYPVAFWQLPGSDEQHVMVEFTNHVSKRKLTLDQETTGFAISPFINSHNQETLLIQPDFYYNFKTSNVHLKTSFEKEPFAEKFIQEITTNALNPNTSTLSDFTGRSLSKDENHYLDIVKNAKQAIQESDLKKVVLARHKEIDLEKNFNAIQAYSTLCIEQNNSFVSLTFTPEFGLWIGASPELLVSINKENIFKTCSLAGTQKFQEEDLSNAVWTQKEIEEQALVSRYIISCFKFIRLREYEEDGPRTVRAGNLIHLKTDFLVNMNEVNFPDLGTNMLDLLHPTSAVCGMPKEAALNFIRDQEDINRKLYSGFLGPVNIDHESHIFVNIRCAELGNQKALVYSGAGITAGSNPEKELSETGMKMKLMEKILNSTTN